MTIGIGYGDGDGYGDGCGCDGYGDGYGDGDGCGCDGYGCGYGDGYGCGGYGYGYGYGDGDGYGCGKSIGSIDEQHEVVVLQPWHYVAIGCQVHSVAYWQRHWAAVAREHNITISTPEVEELLCKALSCAAE